VVLHLQHVGGALPVVVATHPRSDALPETLHLLPVEGVKANRSRGARVDRDEAPLVDEEERLAGLVVAKHVIGARCEPDITSATLTTISPFGASEKHVACSLLVASVSWVSANCSNE